MSLTTPSKIRELQIKLYRKAKNEPDYRFYLLYDKIYRADILSHAYALARANKGAPGVDGQSFEEIESKGLEEWLTGIREELRNKAYQPQPVRRVLIPKPGGGERPLGIPSIKDRVVQTAAKLVIEPIFEADLEPNAYGDRPKRSAQDAIRKVHELLCEGYTDVVDADLSKYFDTIPHCALLQCVARRIVDRNVLRLIKMWLQVPVEERDGNGKRPVKRPATTNLNLTSRSPILKARKAIPKLLEHKHCDEQRKTFELALAWLATNRDTYAGQWVALRGAELLAAGNNARDVYARARAREPSPFVVKIESTVAFRWMVRTSAFT